MNWFSRSLIMTVFLSLISVPLTQTCLAFEPNDTENLIAAIKSESLNDQQFEQLTRFIQPSAREEKWRETPWIPNISDGRKMSAEKNKPIFLWAMNGDPLGCV